MTTQLIKLEEDKFTKLQKNGIIKYPDYLRIICSL